MKTTKKRSPPLIAPAAQPSKRKSRLIRYAIYGLVIVLAVGVRFWLTGPKIPLPELEGLDRGAVEEIENARAAIWESPRQPERWGRMGMLLAAHSFTDEAVQCFERAAELDPQHWKWPYLRSIALERNDPAASRDALGEAAVVAGEEELLPKLILIERLLELGEFDEAERHLSFVLHYEPQHPRGNLDQARLLYARRDAAGALAPLAQADGDRRTRRSAHQLLAQVHRRIGDEAAANEALEKLKSLPPDEAWPDPLREQLNAFRMTKGAYIARINELGQRTQPEMLTRLATEALNRYPELAHLVAARKRLDAGDAAGAERALRKSLRLDPRSIDALLSLGEALTKQAKLPAAEDVFLQAIKVESSNGEAHLRLGQCLAAQKKHAASLAPLRSAVQYMPLSAEAHRALADSLTAVGREEEAEEHRRHAERLRKSPLPSGESRRTTSGSRPSTKTASQSDLQR